MPKIQPGEVSALGADLPVAPHAGPWRNALWRLGVIWIGLILVFAPDWLKMFDQWWNISTFNHVLLIPAIIVWLVWQRKPEIAQLLPRIWVGALAPFGAAVLIWTLGTMAGVDLLRQAGAVAMLPTSAAVLLGPNVMAGLMFPAAYFVFLVPFGEEFVPALQTITAKLTIWLVTLSQVPAVINGVFIDTPAGLFEVAEACSGVKFLSAMIAFGVLVCNVSFLSWHRRCGFLLTCIVAPVLANGVRAWATIYLAQFIGVERAGGIDHIVYGWVFFGLVIAGILAIWWRHFDRDATAAMIDPAAINQSDMLNRWGSSAVPAAAAIAALVAVTLAGQVWARTADQIVAPMPARIFMPAIHGWHRVDYVPQYPWQPRAAGADHRLMGRYADSKGHQVDVFFALYSAQDESRKAGGFGQGALRPDSGWAWVSDSDAISNGKAARFMAQGRIAREAETYYRTGNLLTGSNAKLKLANIRDRILLRGRPTMLLILSAEEHPGISAAQSLAAFHHASGAIAPLMDRVAAGS